MRTALGLVLAMFCATAFGQKWVDEKGKVYYGQPPPGVKVERVPIKGGATSSVGSQGSSSRSSVSDQEADFQKRQARREVIQNNDRVMRDNAANREIDNRILKERAQQRQQGKR
jgi:hypothetical protein